MKVYENRASAVLYYFLTSNIIEYPYPFLLPANVCPVVPLTFLKAQIPFEFVDIDETHAMNKDICLEKLKNNNYGGVLFVHAYGKNFDNTEFYAQIKAIKKDILIIDDRCLCVPRLTEKVLPHIDLELYSTGYAKYVELSYGGWGIIKDELNYQRQEIIFDSGELKAQMDYIRYCLDNKKIYNLQEFNHWMDGSGIENLSSYLKGVEANLLFTQEHKKVINKIYVDRLPKEIQWGSDYSDWRFMIQVDNRSDILKAIFEAGLFAGTNFPSVAYLFHGQYLDVAEKESGVIVNLFNDFRIDEETANRLCEIINSKL